MNPLPRRRRRPVLIVMAVLIGLLGGCSGLLPSPPDRQIYRTAPAFAFPAGLPHVAAQLAVAAPSAPAGLDTRRIALARSPVSLDYYADAEWSDRVPILIQSALVEGFDKSRAISGVGPESLGLSADFSLETAVREFEAVYDSPNGAPRIVIRLGETLVRLPQRRIVAQTTVRSEAPAAANTVPDIVRAFSVALGRAAQDVVVWAATNPALSGKSGSVISRTRFVHPPGGRQP